MHSSEFVENCFSLLHRQYSLVAELESAFDRTYIINDSSSVDILYKVFLSTHFFILNCVYVCASTRILTQNQLFIPPPPSFLPFSKALQELRLLLKCEMDEKEEELVSSHLQLLYDSPVRYSHPGERDKELFAILIDSLRASFSSFCLFPISDMFRSLGCHEVM